MINKKSLLPFLAGMLFLVGMSLFLSARNQKTNHQSETGGTAPQPVSVTTVKTKPENIPVRYEFAGQVAGSLEVEVRSRVTGIIEQQNYQEGGEVKAGQLLFSLDAAPFEAAYQQAQAAIESARAQKVSASAQFKQAQQELKRLTPLAKKQMLSQSQLDVATSAVDIARAQVTVAEAAISQAEANLLTAKINLEYTEIRSPIDGIVGRALQNRGALVQAGSNSLLTTLVQTNPAYINFGIPETDELRMRREIAKGELVLPESGFTVELLDESGNSTGQSGKLDFQDYKVDNSTGNFAMRATIDNKNAMLAPGQFVRVRLNGAVMSNAIAVPQRAVLDGPGGKYVYVVGQGEKEMTIAQQKPVVPGEWVALEEGRENYWIIHSGLEAGDEVIVDGVARIFFPGMPVKAGEPGLDGEQPPAAAQ